MGVPWIKEAVERRCDHTHASRANEVQSELRQKGRMTDILCDFESRLVGLLWSSVCRSPQQSEDCFWPRADISAVFPHCIVAFVLQPFETGAAFQYRNDC